MIGKTTPLHIVCSPCRGVGKTLLARLITELYALDAQPAAAFDLADEGPRLADYLPQSTTVAEIGDVIGQMHLFERLLAHDGGAMIVDVSHRVFDRFFAVVDEIGFFEEARRHAIEPLILFIVDADPRSPAAYAGLRTRFMEASLMPVCNRIETGALSDNRPPIAGALPPALEIPLLGFALRAMIDRTTFSFCQFWCSPPADRSTEMNEALRDWIEDVVWQLRSVEHALGCESRWSPAAAASPRPLLRRRDARIGGDDLLQAPYEVRKFAPRKLRADGAAMDQSAGAVVDMLKTAGDQLEAAEDRIRELESQIERFRNRAVRAETWLQLLQREIEEQLVRPAVAARSKLDDLQS